jgi:hypothetical protein
MKAFDKTKFHDNFFFIMKKMNFKNMHPIKLLSKALSLGDRSMYRTTKPIVPKIIIDNINCILDFIVYSFESAKQLIFSQILNLFLI